MEKSKFFAHSECYKINKYNISLKLKLYYALSL